jgi:hypothetical protein
MTDLTAEGKEKESEEEKNFFLLKWFKYWKLNLTITIITQSSFDNKDE